MADAAERSRALTARAAGPVPATPAEKEAEPEKEEESGEEVDLGGNGPRESRQAKRARAKREKKERKKVEEKGKTPPKGPSVREVLERGP